MKILNLFKKFTFKNEDDSDLPKNPSSHIKLGFIVLILGVGGFFVWAFWADLDQGVPCTATIIVDSKRKVVQHPVGGVIESILVRDGEKVKDGQVLMRLVSTQSQSNLSINRHQAELLRIQLKDLKPLVREGYYPRNQYLDLERQYKDVLSKIKVAEEEMERTEIKSPVAGNVMGLATHTVGGVIAPGSKIMEVVPYGDQLVIEAQIPPHLVDRIRAGLEADVHLTALNQRTTPILQGVVEWISADRLQDPAKPEIAYYMARISLTEQAQKILQSEKLVAGMPADVVIKTGERSFWSYLTKPFVDRARLSMKER